MSQKNNIGFDPETQPILKTEALPKLPADCLQLDYIRDAFSRPIDWQVDPLFSDSFLPNCHIKTNAREAAVLVPFVQRSDGVKIILTKRSDHLNNHAGQISFPGGRIENSDADPIAAAIRETYEEIGVKREFVRVIGTQPTLLTTTDFLMTPIIGEILPGFNIHADTSEVAEVFEVPLAVLMDPNKHVVHQLQTATGHGRYYFSITWNSYFIWGATAVLIRNLYHFLAASKASNN